MCARLFTGEIERNYGNFSLSTMNGDISLLGQNCARDDFHHISLFLDHNGRTVDTFLQEILMQLFDVKWRQFGSKTLSVWRLFLFVVVFYCLH